LPSFCCLGLENLDELAADDLALLLGIGNALQVAHELRAGVDVHDLDAEAAGKGVHHLLGFVEAQQAVVDENAGELVADRAVDQRRRHRRIDAARKAEDDLLLPTCARSCDTPRRRSRACSSRARSRRCRARSGR
jgi:hypothetical protein